MTNVHPKLYVTVSKLLEWLKLPRLKNDEGTPNLLNDPHTPQP